MDINHFVSEYIPGLTSEIAAGSIYKYIEKELGLHISYSQRVIEVQPCTEDDRKYLDLNGTDYVVVVKNFTHLYDGSQFEYTESPPLRYFSFFGCGAEKIRRWNVMFHLFL